MIYSNERKLCLSGWLKENSETSYNTPLKLQKFLLLYEAFAKTSGEQPDFTHLRGYKKGPVFSNVWGDYTKERSAFNAAAVEAYEAKKDIINIERAKKCAFVVRTMTETELSQKLTEEHFDVLMTLAEQENLHNPVYVDIDEEGRLLVD